jgi:hypothetical protein
MRTAPLAEFRVGVFQTSITGAIRRPRYPVPLRKMRENDPITLTVLAILDGRRRFFLYSFDTLAVYRAVYAELQRAVARTFATPPGRVILFASHNHSAEDWHEGFDRRKLTRIVLAASRKALGGAVPVEIGHRRGRASERVQVNRRCFISPRMGSLSVVFNDLCKPAGWTWDATRQIEKYVSDVSGRKYVSGHRLLLNGKVDPTLDVIVFRRPDGSVLASWVNFAMHPVIVSKRIGPYFSADYVHYLRRRVQAGTGAPVFFTVGTSGDIRPNYRENSFAECRRIGESVARDAIALLDGMKFQPLTSVRTASAQLSYPLRRDVQWTPGEAGRAYASLQEKMKRAKETRAPFWRIKRLADGLQTYENGVFLRLRYRDFALPPAEAAAARADAVITRLQLNDLDVIAVPGEVFHEIGKRIRRQAAKRHGARAITACAAFLHYYGYLVTAREFRRGGFEQTACLSGGHGDDLMVKKALSLWRLRS